MLEKMLSDPSPEQVQDSMDTVTVSIGSQEAAKRLQLFWRLCKDTQLTKQIVKLFQDTNLSRQNVLAISFEQLLVRLREADVLCAAKLFINRLYKLCTHRHDTQNPGTDGNKRVNIRVVLAAFMIYFRPTHVFETMDPGSLEHSLFDAAKALVDHLESIIECISANESFRDVPVEVSVRFEPLLTQYLRSFKAWKGPDLEKMITRIEHALIALYIARAKQSEEDPANSTINAKLDAEIARLRAKLSNLAGADALERLDTRYSATTGDAAVA